MATRQYTCRGRATKLFKCSCQCPPCNPYCVSGPYLSHHDVLFRPKDLTLHFHPPALLFVDAAVAWVKGRSYWRMVNLWSILWILFPSHYPGLPWGWMLGRGAVYATSPADRPHCGLPQEADPPPPGTSPADRPHTWDGVDYRKSRLSVPKIWLPEGL